MVSPTRRNNIVNRVMQCFDDNDDNMFPEQKGTLYNLFNAVTEYVDHYRSKKDDDDSDEGGSSISAMFGTGDVLKTKAYNILVDVAKSAPERTTPIYSLPTTQLQIPDYSSIQEGEIVE